MAEDDVLPRLVATHPLLFRDFHPGRSYLPAGWFAIVDKLCYELEQILGDDAPKFTVYQIKEKFASLRFYYALDVPEPTGEPLPAAVTEHAGGYRVAARSRHPKRRALDEAIALAGLASEKTCESCGAAGEQLADGAYVYVACRKHRRRGSITAAEYLARRRQAEQD